MVGIENILLAINEGNIHSIIELLTKYIISLKSFDIENYENKVCISIDELKKRYGKGAILLGPCGFYNPTGILDIVCDNVSRGRLYKKKPCGKYYYEYDYDYSARIKRIICIPNSTVTLCNEENGMQTFITYKIREKVRVLENIACAFYDANERLIAMIDVMLRDYGKFISNVNIEKHDYEGCGNQLVKWYNVVGDKREANILIVETDYWFKRDENNEVSKWQQLSRVEIKG